MGQEERTIGEIVADDYRTATVFKSFGIDFCCKGGRSIASACDAKGIDTNDVLEALDEVDRNKVVDGTEDYKSWPLDLLIDLIEKRHHTYVEDAITDLRPLLEKVAKVHGAAHPELIEIQRLFLASAGELTQHMKKEELILFPFIRKMLAAKKGDRSIPMPDFGSVESPVSRMQEEHEQEGERFGQISALSNAYTPPVNACNTYRLSYSLLKEFEDDLHRHIHLENNILFPRAKALEKELRR